MIFIKTIKKIMIASGGMLLMSHLFADTAQMNATLARINLVLSQINPLINAAEEEQDPHARVQFQFHTLRADINKIQSGIAQQINRVSIQPRQVTPLAGDYLPAQDKGG